MRNKRAKQLARLATKIVLAEGRPLNEGVNEYKQARNCVSWEPAHNPNGSRMIDPDGSPLLKPVKNPGTVVSACTRRNVYKNLKRLWLPDPRHPVFREAFL